MLCTPNAPKCLARRESGPIAARDVNELQYSPILSPVHVRNRGRPIRRDYLPKRTVAIADTLESMSRVTVPDLMAMKHDGRRITMVTAYDATFAGIVDEAGIDIILVGDSVGTVVQGISTTLPVTIDEMEYHVRMVSRAQPNALIVADLPFGSYQVSPEQAVASSIRLIKAGAGAVKLEGGIPMFDSISAIVRVDIPVMGHIGLTPQSYHRMGGHRVQGRHDGHEAGGRERLREDAHAVEQAGAFSMVIEGVPRDLAASITHKVSIPTIGIGAGPECDGQVLVLHDLLGLTTRHLKFTKSFANLRESSVAACTQFALDVRDGNWPDDSHSFH